MELKDIFLTKKLTSIKEPVSWNVESFEVYNQDVSGASFQVQGMKDAGLALGSPNALRPRVHATYIKLQRYFGNDETAQNARKSKIRQEIAVFEASKATLNSEMKSKADRLEIEESKIRKLIDEIADIKKHPEKLINDTFVNVSFWIGTVILIFLTVYLFIFYSSAAYSAFFKIFKVDDNEIAKAIFDAQAIGKAWIDGLTELIFIIAIPAVFLGLGFLIYKFSEEKKTSNYFKIGALIIVTFVFDFIIAYEIVEKIYNIKKEGSFVEMPDMNISMSLREIDFWLIIFAGFVVYLIWGFVFSFVMKEYEKMHTLQYAIKSKEKQLKQYKQECKVIKNEESSLQSKRNDIQGEIDKLNVQLESPVIYFKDVSEGINNYTAGWIQYMRGAKMPQSEIDECSNITLQFLDYVKLEIAKKLPI
ncbi:MAG: hypothetical protein LBG17_06900 [Bacteroidales bacterium]|jgi:uncharacterized protein YlxW (UPF0749 family)|nr:hypothetical protein [Bacteroidales bacterium]